VAADAPQPTDDGLAVVAEIGGDLSAPVLETEPFEGRGSPAEGERGGRRSRRSRGGRNRFPPRVADHDFGADAALEPAPSDALAPSAADDAAPAVNAEADVLVADAESGWTPELANAREEPAAPPTQPSGEESAIAAAAPEETAPVGAAVAERAEAAFTPPAVEPAPHTSASAEAEAQAAPTPAEHADETPRPRRTGWWQRARASIVGD
jgi:ribonuclease E